MMHTTDSYAKHQEGDRIKMSSLCVPPQTLESRLKITLPEDLGEALSNGTILCQLVNQIRPRSVSIIHIPSPAVVSVTAKSVWFLNSVPAI